MSLIHPAVLRMLVGLRAVLGEDGGARRMASRFDPSNVSVPKTRASANGIDKQWTSVAGHQEARVLLADAETIFNADAYARNVENMAGTVKVPVGFAGPLRVNGLHANGDYRVPMATTEAALVASYSRGAEIVTDAGGAAVAMVAEGVLRSPGFSFDSLHTAGMFVDWVARNAPSLKDAAEVTTRHGLLVSIEPKIDNEVVFLLCRYTTGDAAGQNMVTVATEALCREIEARCPIRPRHWFVEANFSGDKKASYLGLISGRGRKVTASVLLPAALVEHRLHTTVERMLDYARMANLGALLSGQIGAQGHYANGLAALYLATGQDVACVAESAVGFSRMEGRDCGLYVSVTLPNVLVGTVGGGTGLPSQSACLDVLGLKGAGHAAALAEVAGALCLAGEISIISAIAGGRFARAHAALRGRK